MRYYIDYLPTDSLGAIALVLGDFSSLKELANNTHCLLDNRLHILFANIISWCEEDMITLPPVHGTCAGVN